MNDYVVPVGAPRICPVCGKSDGKIKKIDLRQHLQLEKPTDWSLCEKDKKLFDDGFIAMVEVFDPKEKIVDGKLLEMNASRTGRIYHLRRALAQDFFQKPIDPAWPLCFVSNKNADGKDMMQALSEWMIEVHERAAKKPIVEL